MSGVSSGRPIADVLIIEIRNKTNDLRKLMDQRFEVDEECQIRKADLEKWMQQLHELEMKIRKAEEDILIWIQEVRDDKNFASEKPE